MKCGSSRQDGSSQPQQVTTGGSAQRYAPQWSADSKKIVFGDKNGRVYVATVATKQMQTIVDARNGQITDYEFSPKGNFISYSMGGVNGVQSVYIWSAEENKNYRCRRRRCSRRTTRRGTRAGGYLYFLSDREYAPMIGTTEFNYASNRSDYVYALALRKDSKNPFPPESDEVAITEEKKEGAPGRVALTCGSRSIGPGRREDRLRRDRRPIRKGSARRRQLRWPDGNERTPRVQRQRSVLLRTTG
jgi:tricorn protease